MFFEHRTSVPDLGSIRDPENRSLACILECRLELLHQKLTNIVLLFAKYENTDIRARMIDEEDCYDFNESMDTIYFPLGKLTDKSIQLALNFSPNERFSDFVGFLKSNLSSLTSAEKIQSIAETIIYLNFEAGLTEKYPEYDQVNRKLIMLNSKLDIKLKPFFKGADFRFKSKADLLEIIHQNFSFYEDSIFQQIPQILAKYGLEMSPVLAA